MIYTKWNSPEAVRRRVTGHITQEARQFGRCMPNDKIDVNYTTGQLLENAEYLLKDAIDDSRSRDLHEVAKVSQSLKDGSTAAYHSTSNTKDFGIVGGGEYEPPKDWSLAPITLWDQRDRLRKAAALIIMELERLDRMNMNGRDVGYGMFNPEHMAEKKAADTALEKMRQARAKRQELDIYKQIMDNTGSVLTSNGIANVTASSQPQFSGAVQPMPQTIPCQVY